MKAFVVGRYGSSDGVQMREVPEPGVGAHDVLVEVRAASVNLLDAKIRDGEFKQILPYRVPFVLGHDVAGVVVRAGPAVRSFAPGDEVYARPGQDHIGTFAELAAVHQDDLARKPATLTMEESAALPLVALTAWQALVERADLRPGQKILIHAGSGGVGTIAIQLAKHLGAHVATTTGTANTGWVKNLGADVVIDYKREDFETIVRGYDVVLDSLGGQTLEKSLRVLRPGGIAIGLAGPPDPAFARQIGANPVVRLATVLLSARTRLRARRRHVRYSFLFMKASGEQLRAIAALADAGTIRPVIDRVFPFGSAKDAMAYVESGRAKGKVVVTMADLAADPPGHAASRHVITFDNRGVGATTGTTPDTIQAMAADAVTFIRALGLNQVDLLGFSMGGMIAQVIAQDEPQLVRKLILAGTGPAGGEGIKNVTRISNLDTIRALLTFTDPKQFLFFTRTPNGRRAGQEFLARLKERTRDRDKKISLRSYAAQLKAIHRWGLQQPSDLSVIHQPVLVANGDSDKMVPTKNSADLARRLPGSELVIYPDAGHGGIFQFHAQFAQKALEFLGR